MTSALRAFVAVSILIVALALRGQAALFSVSDQDVIDAGRQAHQEVMSQYGYWNDVNQQARVDRLGRNLTRFSTRPEIQYQFYLLNSDIFNALATPDGSVHVTRGLLQHFTDDNLLSFVLAHEITHVELRHGKQAIESAMATQAGASLLAILLGQNSAAAQIGINGAALWLNMKYSRDHEYQADEGGMKLLNAAGIDPHYGPKALQTLFEAGQAQPGLLDKYFGTHPLPQDRIPRAQQVADSLRPPGSVAESASPSTSGALASGINGTGILRGEIASVSKATLGQQTLLAYDENGNVVLRAHPTRQGYYRLRLREGAYAYSLHPENSTIVFQQLGSSRALQPGERQITVRANRITYLNLRVQPS